MMYGALIGVCGMVTVVLRIARWVSDRAAARWIEAEAELELHTLKLLNK